MSDSGILWLNNPAWEEIISEQATACVGEDWRKCIAINSEQHTTITKGRHSMRAECLPKMGILKTYIYIDGLRENPSPDIPSVCRWDKNGRLRERSYYKDGELQNPTDNTPAVESYYEIGGVRIIEFRINGVLQDPAPNIPARTQYYECGAIREISYFSNGENTDLESGLPAMITYSISGEVKRGWSSKEKALTAEQATKMINKVTRKLLKNLCGDDHIVALSGKGNKSVDEHSNSPRKALVRT